MAKDLPSGTVTFLFSDMEGSTQLLRELGDAYDTLLDLHHRLLREAWARHRGVEVNTEGDAFFVAFADARDALAAAIDGQRALATAAWPTERAVRVRMGLHSGYARPVDDDYRALAVHQAARVVGAANGGQILATGDVIELVGDGELPVELDGLGRFRVRDFDEPVTLYGVSAPGLAPDDRPPRVRPADRHNLLRPATSLINRVDELADLAECVRPGVLVTLLGPGGAGKTRLSIEVGFELVDRWNDGVWFVDLAPLTVSELVPAAVASAVGAPSGHRADTTADLVAHLAEQSMLIVLDNCEHLVESAARLVDELRRSCPALAVLATSRVPLGLLGETTYRLEPLDTDGDGSDGVRLFLERAGVAAEHDLSDVVELCRAVDGLPLAIELAASRAHAVAPAELASRLAARVGVVSTRDPTLPDRQRSLDRLLDWTIDLLGPDERLLLTRLAVIADSFDLELAEAVGADDALAAAAVPDLVWTLLEWSLLNRDSASGARRYSLLGTVRAHVRQRSAPDELVGAVRRLATAYMERLGPGRPMTRQWVTEMGIELDNVRAVVGDDAIPDAVARSLAWSVGQYHDVTSSYRAGIAELARCAEARSDPGPDLVALLTLRADLHLRLGELADADRLARRAAEVEIDVGQPWWDDACLVRTQGEIAIRSHDPATAIRLASDALSAGPATRRAEARLWNLVALANNMLGDLEAATTALEHCVRAEQEAGLEIFFATTLGNYAEALMQLGDPAGAAQYQLSSLDHARSMGQTIQIAFASIVAARLALADGSAADAVRIQAGADAIIEHEGFQLYPEDAQLRDELLRASRATLGAAAFDRACAAGRASPADRLADEAATILTRHAGHHQPTLQGG